MNRATQVGILGGVAALTLTGVGYGETGTASYEDLQARLSAAEAKLAALEGTQNTMSEARAEEIRGLVYDVLADADTRASLLQGGGGGGYDNGFVLSSGDGNFMLRMNGQIQTRFIYNNQDAGTTGAVDENRSGFENTRTKLIFSGHVVNPQWTYKIETNFSRSGGGATLQDAWINYDFENGWGLSLGQYKIPLLREELVDSSMQLAVERSTVNEFFSGQRTQGAMLTYEDESGNFRAAMSFDDGPATANTVWSALDTEVSVTARGELLLEGDFDSFVDFTSRMDDPAAMMVGGAIHYNKGEYGTAAGPEVETMILTGDFSWEGGGWNVFAGFAWADIDAGAGSTDLNPWGFVVQGGMFFEDDLEGYIRYEYLDFDVSGVDEQGLLTVGINKYIADHNAKLTADFGYGFDPVAFNGTTLTGWRTDVPSEDGQFVIRTQMQLLF